MLGTLRRCQRAAAVSALSFGRRSTGKDGAANTARSFSLLNSARSNDCPV